MIIAVSDTPTNKKRGAAANEITLSAKGKKLISMPPFHPPGIPGKIHPARCLFPNHSPRGGAACLCSTYIRSK